MYLLILLPLSHFYHVVFIQYSICSFFIAIFTVCVQFVSEHISFCTFYTSQNKFCEGYIRVPRWLVGQGLKVCRTKHFHSFFFWSDSNETLCIWWTLSIDDSDKFLFWLMGWRWGWGNLIHFIGSASHNIEDKVLFLSYFWTFLILQQYWPHQLNIFPCSSICSETRVWLLGLNRYWCILIGKNIWYTLTPFSSR